MINIRKLESELWESADLLRSGSKLTSNQYCMPVMGLIFLRYAYSRFKRVEEEILKNRPSRGGRVMPVEASDFTEKSALYLPKEAQYDYLVNLPENIALAELVNIEGQPMLSLGEVVNNAMSLVESQSEQLTGVLPKDYTIFSDELLAELLRIFNNSALDDVGGDIIGRIYEYFLNKFAKNIASDDGVFFTPKSLVKMIVNIIEPKKGILLDPACGSGGMFIQSGDFVNAAGMNANSTMTFYGQEKVEYNAQLCLMNMAVHGLSGVIKSGDEANTFYNDAHNLNGCCDYVMANPPFNVDKVKAESCESAGRVPFGMPGINKNKEVGNANYLWISYFYSYLNEHGRAGFVMASSATDSQIIELKKHNVDVRNAYDDNFTDYQDTIPQLFYYNAFLMLSNGLEAKIGTLGSKYEFFHEWKRLEENEQGSVELETMLRGICKKENFLDLLENFILYDHSGGHTAKILARNHQYLGVNEAVKAYSARKLNNGKLGVFWHTQGSGKSYSMVFLSQKIRRKFKGSPTIVILTDRDELNSQISDTFENCGLLGKTKASQFIAASGRDLIQKLKGNPSFIFTLIQKFNKPDETEITPDHDIIIMSDEAHRSQYGIYADNMMKLLPTASRIGFTGTPLLSSDNITARTFGGYISIYDFKRAVEDGATVPLYYENRGEKIRDLHNPKITDEILDAIEKADLDVNQQDKVEAEFAKEIHILMADSRLKEIAADFVRHYSDLWTSGKAMFVCLNRVTCVEMYDFVKKYWDKEIDNLKAKLKSVSQQEALELERKIKWMQETEMAVIISPEQNEIQTFRKWKLDIIPHREKMEKRELDKEFKESENPLRIVFVCAMWLTGFDVKSLSCLYLDKPLKAHTLMQTIARANRVNEGKSNGLIIDYIGIVKELREALAAYTANAGGNTSIDPTIDKEELIKRINDTIEKTKEFLKEKDFDLQQLIDSRDFQKLSLLQTAANAVCGNIKDKKTFSTYASDIIRLMKYTDRSDVTGKTRKEYEAIAEIYFTLQKKRKHVDTTDLMVEINSIINDYVEIESKPTDDGESSRRFDISAIDFDLLRREFSKVKKKNLALKDLDELIQQKLERMLFTNPERINYYERYQSIIDDYNKEQNRATIEKTFMDLMDLAKSMDREEKRYVREGFASDEELSLYDMLFKDDLSKSDIQKIKEVAVDLLQKVKAKISEFDHWTDKQETKAAVDNLIRDILWDGLPESYDEISILAYRQRIYEYVYTRYKNAA